MLVTLLAFLIPEVMSQLSAHGPHCLSCQAVASPDQCLSVVQCKENQQCYTQRLLHNHRDVFYKLGCMNIEDCSFFNNLASALITGRSTSTDTLQCAECCADNFCNLHRCDIHDTSSGFINCMDCQQIADAAENCHTVRPCGPGKRCYARYSNEYPSIDGAREFLFDMGCWTPTECDVAKNLTSTGCVDCCHTQFCNMHLCDHYIYG